MQAYPSKFERPPPIRLVTRRLGFENRYNWKGTLAKRKEIADTTNQSSPIVSGYDDIFARKTSTSTINSTLSDSKLDIDNGLQCTDLIDEEIEYINQDRNDKELNITKESKESKYVVNTSKISETNNSGSCQNSFTPVSRGAKPAKCNESNVYFNVSNKFTILEIEPCMESFDVKNDNEHQSFEKPLISKAIKKKKKNAKRKTTLEHSKVIEEICLKNNKIDNLAKCELRCNLCFKEHFPQSKEKQ